MTSLIQMSGEIPQTENEIKIGFTGTRQGMTNNQKLLLFKKLMEFKISEFHHGDCVGADAEAHDIVDKRVNCKIHIHPPDNSKGRAFKAGDIIEIPKPYLERNHDIVDAVDLLIAAPDNQVERLRSGTWATIRYARQRNKTLIILEP